MYTWNIDAGFRFTNALSMLSTFETINFLSVLSKLQQRYPICSFAINTITKQLAEATIPRENSVEQQISASQLDVVSLLQPLNVQSSPIQQGIPLHQHVTMIPPVQIISPPVSIQQSPVHSSQLPPPQQIFRQSPSNLQFIQQTQIVPSNAPFSLVNNLIVSGNGLNSLLAPQDVNNNRNMGLPTNQNFDLPLLYQTSFSSIQQNK